MKTNVGLLSIVVLLSCNQLLAQTSQEDQAIEMFLKTHQLEKARSNRSLPILAKMLTNRDIAPDLYESLELTDEQSTEIKMVVSDHEARTREVEQLTSSPSQYTSLEDHKKAMKTRLDSELGKRLSEILLSHQLTELLNMDVFRSGVSKLVTQSPMSDVIELTDSQRKRIQKKSDELAEKIAEMIHESRQEAYDVVFEELTPDQIERLTEHYSHDLLTAIISQASLNKLYGHHVYTLPESLDKDISPSFLIMKSKSKVVDK